MTGLIPQRSGLRSCATTRATTTLMPPLQTGTGTPTSLEPSACLPKKKQATFAPVHTHIQTPRQPLRLSNPCSFEYSSFGGGAATAEDEDAYARRMWEAMRRRGAGGQRPSPATAETWARADEAQDKRRRAAEDAAERSRRILDEEQARDRAWRQAVQQVGHEAQSN